MLHAQAVAGYLIYQCMLSSDASIVLHLSIRVTLHAWWNLRCVCTMLSNYTRRHSSFKLGATAVAADRHSTPCIRTELASKKNLKDSFCGNVFLLLLIVRVHVCCHCLVVGTWLH
jgi:hypothetical protein